MDSNISNSWLEKDSILERNLEFENFSQALAFVTRVGILAEKYDHHPDILMHSYKKVKIMLTTHSHGKVTQKDYELAREINSILKDY